MREWMRVVLPPSSCLGAFAAVYVLIEVLSLIFSWTFWPGQFLAETLRGSMAGGGVLIMASACYGAFRAVAFSPVFRAGYRRWLELTPWTAEMPLPLGPVHLVWQDLVVVALLGILAGRHREIGCLDPAMAFGCFYALLSVLSLLAVRQYRLVTGLLFVSACISMTDMLPPGLSILCALALMVGVCLVASWGVKRSLRDFPWELEEHEKFVARWTARAPHGLFAVGWPYHALKPHPSGPVVSPATGTVVSLMLGWWFFAAFVGEPVRSYEIREYWFTYKLGVVLLGLGRGLVYCFGYLPPISLWGRIRTGRWIVPGYDRVLVAPICILLAGYYFPRLVISCGAPFSVAISLSVLVVVLLTLNLGPNLSDWRLTGTHRMVAPAIGASDARTSQGIAKI